MKGYPQDTQWKGLKNGGTGDWGLDSNDSSYNYAIALGPNKVGLRITSSNYQRITLQNQVDFTGAK